MSRGTTHEFPRTSKLDSEVINIVYIMGNPRWLRHILARKSTFLLEVVITA